MVLKNKSIFTIFLSLVIFCSLVSSALAYDSYLTNTILNMSSGNIYASKLYEGAYQVGNVRSAGAIYNTSIARYDGTTGRLIKDGDVARIWNGGYIYTGTSSPLSQPAGWFSVFGSTSKYAFYFYKNTTHEFKVDSDTNLITTGNIYSNEIFTNSANITENVDIGGDLTVVGDLNIRSMGVFAYALPFSGTTTNITSAGVYYPIQNIFNNTFMEEFHINLTTIYGPAIVFNNSYPYYFEVKWHATLKSNSAGSTACVAIKKNNITDTASITCMYLKYANEPVGISGLMLDELAPGDTIQLATTSDAAGSQTQFDYFTTSIKRFY